MKAILKGILHGLCLTLVFPLALLSGFGRVESVYLLGAQYFALFPGLPGDYIRIAWYCLTLRKCASDSRIQFGSFFVHPQVEVGHGVYIGCHCVLGQTTIGDRTHIASGVQILSGKRQHGRDAEGRIQGAGEETFETVPIGADCWIGAGVIVMAEVGEGTTIGAGSVVTKPIAPGSVAVGIPARPLDRKSPTGQTADGATP